MNNIMNTVENILPTKPVNLIHNAGSDYSCITLAVTRTGMKITSVTLDSYGEVTSICENEIKEKGGVTSLTLNLPPHSYVVVRDLLELGKEDVLNRAVAWLRRYSALPFVKIRNIVRMGLDKVHSLANVEVLLHLPLGAASTSGRGRYNSGGLNSRRGRC